MIISKGSSNHYKWGNNCDGWPLVDSEALSVKQEKMPAGTQEERHFHEYANQFFYVLLGELVIEIENEQHRVTSGEGITVEPGKRHQVMNQSEDFTEFLVVSQPSIKNDRINL
ncbi:cupin domain-containing protein [Saccharibacillus kuerlensis]|uniref:Cupin n=1 Tax=Saccharibacillus kuerlensis TaxID=459527 RepID=A0ABQ2LA90_9BACL|nr:cupin domain-containing protein [Saccharibacillus kuerlensis]GGO08419.1 cupin [Saccharibacillus kuerlensis]